MQEGDQIEVRISDLARGGKGVGRMDTGQIVFVPFTAPGDLVEARVDEIKKNYAFASLVSVIEPSPVRVQARCSVFTRCGGCEWQHIPYELQWKTKVAGLVRALERVQVSFVGKVEEIPAEQIWEYRNRVQLRGFKDELGFYGRGSKDLIAIECCPIARPEINAALGRVKEAGLTRERPYKVELAVDEKGELSEAWNSPHAALGFRQIHDAQNKKLQDWVAERVPSGALVLDLFGGRGNLSRHLCERVDEVHCVDVGAASGRSEGDPENFFSYRSDVKEWLEALPREVASNSANQRVAILDPPREGLSVNRTAILAVLEKLKVTRLVFVGCDADAWAQDLSRTCRRGWQVTEVAALDLFPQTHHIEALSVVERKA